MPCGLCSEKEYTKDHQSVQINPNRGCTDIVFLLLWIAGWVAIAGIVATAQSAGSDPDKIIRGVDLLGRICGKSPGVEHLPLAAYPYPPAFRTKICVDTCNYTSQTDSTRMGWLYESKQFLHYCIPAPVSAPQGSISVEITLTGDFDDWATAISRAVGDIFTAERLIYQGVGVTFVLVFLWAGLLRFIADFLVWISILAIVVAGFTIGDELIAFSRTMDRTVAPERAKFVKLVGQIIFWGTLVFCFIILALKKRIQIAIEVVKEAAHAINDNKFIVFFPAVPVGLCLLYFVFWIYGALHIFSASELKPHKADVGVLQFAEPNLLGEWGTLFGQTNQNYDDLNCTDINDCPLHRFKFLDEFKYLGLFHFFHLLWSVQFFFYFGYFVTAGTIAYWYFTPRDDSGNKVGLSHLPVIDSIARTCRYHLGTIAFGSFIIAVVQFIRFVIMYIEHQTKDKEENELQKLVFCLIHCCLKCVECCLDKINKHAFIWTAIWGDSFLVAACSSFALIWRNLARVAALSMVSHFLFFLGKVFIGLSAATIMGIQLLNSEAYVNEIYSPLLPCALMFLIAYVLASLFMLIFASAVDTIFICFLVDEEENGKKGKEMLAPESLQKLVGKYHARSQKAAHLHQMKRPTHAQAYREAHGHEDFVPGDDTNAGTPMLETKSEASQ